MRRLSGELVSVFRSRFRHIKAKTGGEYPSESHIDSFQTTEEPPYLRIENVSFLYPNTQAPVLNHINVTLKKGERVALVGPNGAGKTTLARVLLGLYRPQTGTIHVGDTPLNEENRQEWLTHCSAVFQDFTSLPPHRTRKYYLWRFRTSGTYGRGINRGWVSLSC